MADATGAASAKPKSFEDALAELEEIVEQLESGAKPLDESLDLYEKGVAALKHCHGILDKAEKRIRTLVQNQNGAPTLQDGELPVARKPASRKSAPPDAENPDAPF